MNISDPIFQKNINEEFSKTLKYIFKISKKMNIISLGIGSSVERAISLSLIVGFSKIIVLGVDLKNRRYFWKNNDKNFKDLSNKQKGFGYHDTAIKKLGNLLLRFIKILDTIARKNYNSKILISTNRSLLSSKLEKYDWSK